MASAPAPSLALPAPSIPSIAPVAPPVPSFGPQRDTTAYNEGIINRGAAPQPAPTPNNQGTFFNFNPPAANADRPAPLQPQAFNSAPAPAGRTAPAATPGPSGEARIEAGNVAVNVLNRAGIANYRMLSAADTPASVKNHDAVWSANGILGTLRIFAPGADPGLDRIRGDLLSANATACKGRFASGVAPDAERPNTTSLFTQCDGENGFSAFYLVIPRSSGGHYLISLVTAPDKDQDIRAASATYRSAAAQVIP
jgi:hypothetical protein